MTPSGDVTKRLGFKVCFWKAYWSHVTVVLDGSVEFYQCYVKVAAVIVWMFENFFDRHVLLVSFQTVEVIFTWQELKIPVEKRGIVNNLVCHFTVTIHLHVFVMLYLRFSECRSAPLMRRPEMNYCQE